MAAPKLPDEFFQAVLQVANRRRMNPEDLLLIMAHESGLRTDVYNKNGYGSGLVGFMPFVLKNLGFEGGYSDFIKLTHVQQMEYVDKLLEQQIKMNGGRPFQSAVQYHIGNFLPAALHFDGVRNQRSDAIIVQRNPIEPLYRVKPTKEGNIAWEKMVFEHNAGMDVDHDGNITYGDFEKRLSDLKNQGWFQEVLNNFRKATSYVPTEKSKSDSPTSSEDSDAVLAKKINQLSSELDKTWGEVGNMNDSDILSAFKLSSNHNLLIKISSDNVINKIEFARILSGALDEELQCNAFVYTNNDEVEVGCSLPNYKYVLAAKELAVALEDIFHNCTKKIGGISVKCSFDNKKSEYQGINMKTAANSYRKFIQKFI